MNQPTETIKPKKPQRIVNVYHSLTCDCDDVTITKFVEYMDTKWHTQWHPLFNIKTMRFDIGHDILHFETFSAKLDLIKYILKLSQLFPKMFFMYDFYTINEADHKQGTYFVMNGKITDQNMIANKTEV